VRMRGTRSEQIAHAEVELTQDGAGLGRVKGEPAGRVKVSGNCERRTSAQQINVGLQDDQTQEWWPLTTGDKRRSNVEDLAAGKYGIYLFVQAGVFA